MTDWIEWNGGECPIKSDKTRVDIRLRDGFERECDNILHWRWDHWFNKFDIIAYRIIEGHEPMTQTREQITAQIYALQKQLDTLPVSSRVLWGPPGSHYFTHEEVAEVIDDVPHIHGVAMKKLEN